MNSKSWLIAIANCVFMFVCACGSGERSGEADGSGSGATAGGGRAAATTTVPAIMGQILPEAALDMTTRFQTTIGSSNNLNAMVWTDIASLQSMLQRYAEADRTHIRMYFGIKQDTMKCPGSNDVERNYLTIVFEGASRDGESGSEPNPCIVCGLNDNPGQNMNPFDLAQPCPPPSCRGNARFLLDH